MLIRAAALMICPLVRGNYDWIWQDWGPGKYYYSWRGMMWGQFRTGRYWRNLSFADSREPFVSKLIIKWLKYSVFSSGWQVQKIKKYRKCCPVLENSIKMASTERENVLFNKSPSSTKLTAGLNITSLCCWRNSGNIHYVEVLLLQKKQNQFSRFN